MSLLEDLERAACWMEREAKHGSFDGRKHAATLRSAAQRLREEMARTDLNTYSARGVLERINAGPLAPPVDPHREYPTAMPTGFAPGAPSGETVVCQPWCGKPRKDVPPGQVYEGYRQEQVFCSRPCIVAGRPLHPSLPVEPGKP